MCCTARSQWGLAESRWRWALKRRSKQSCASCPAAARGTGVPAVLGVPSLSSKGSFGWDGIQKAAYPEEIWETGWA